LALCGYHVYSFDSCEDIEFLATKKPRQKGITKRRDFHLEIYNLLMLEGRELNFFRMGIGSLYNDFFQDLDVCLG
jgi:hypothetical protein